MVVHFVFEGFADVNRDFDDASIRPNFLIRNGWLANGNNACDQVGRCKSPTINQGTIEDTTGGSLVQSESESAAPDTEGALAQGMGGGHEARRGGCAAVSGGTKARSVQVRRLRGL
jgi:hypothetical protein